VQAIGLEHIVVVAISRSDQGLRLHADIGSRFPALISASGRCVAAFSGHPWSTLERRFRALRWDRPPTLKTWRAEVEATRAKGYAVDEGNYIRGVTIIAAPVRPSGGPVSHVVVVVGVSEQVRQTGVDTLARELRTIAESLRIGWSGRGPEAPARTRITPPRRGPIRPCCHAGRLSGGSGGAGRGLVGSSAGRGGLPIKPGRRCRSAGF
jgi:hypothetical protein